jgi:hypothetical protein
MTMSERAASRRRTDRSSLRESLSHPIVIALVSALLTPAINDLAQRGPAVGALAAVGVVAGGAFLAGARPAAARRPPRVLAALAGLAVALLLLASLLSFELRGGTLLLLLLLAVIALLLALALRGLVGPDSWAQPLLAATVAAGVGAVIGVAAQIVAPVLVAAATHGPPELTIRNDCAVTISLPAGLGPRASIDVAPGTARTAPAAPVALTVTRTGRDLRVETGALTFSQALAPDVPIRIDGASLPPDGAPRRVDLTRGRHEVVVC